MGWSFQGTMLSTVGASWLPITLVLSAGTVFCAGLAGLLSAASTGVTSSSRQAMMSVFKVSPPRSEEHTSELQSLMRISYAVFCLKKKKEKYAYTLSIQYTRQIT